MNAVLEFPPIHAAEVATEVVDAAPAALVTLRQHTMQPLSAVERGIAELRAEHGSTAYDIQTPAGYRLATLRRAAVRAVRYQVPKLVKIKKAELAEMRDLVDTEGERIVGLLRQIEDPHDALIGAEDARKEAIRAEAARLDAERQERHRTAIDLIRSYLLHAQEPGMTAARLEVGIAAFAEQTYQAADWEDFQAQAQAAHAETLDGMRRIHAQIVAREAEAARQEAIRLENQRVAAELAAERLRIAEEAAEVRRQQEALAAEGRALAARLAAEQQAREDARDHAIREGQRLSDLQLAIDRRAAAETSHAITAALRGDTTEFIKAPAPTGEGKAVTPSAGTAETALNATTASPRVSAMGAGQAADAAPAAGEPATLSLSALCRRLQFAVTGDFLRDALHIAPAKTDKRAMLYTERQFGLICRQLQSHVAAMAEMYDTATA